MSREIYPGLDFSFPVLATYFMNRLLKHLREKRYNISYIAREINISPQYIHNCIKGSKTISLDAQWRILAQISPIVIDGFIVTHFKEDSTFYLERKLPGWEEATAEDKGDHLVYLIPMSRDLITDIFELDLFLNPKPK